LRDRERAAAIVEDYREAPLAARETAILDYAVKLTLSPRTMGRRDVERLRDAGLSDAEILDVCQVTAYYNYVNRLADGLGVELEGPTTISNSDIPSPP
jgi:uncharacterized peroxidase-related enzyme